MTLAVTTLAACAASLALNLCAALLPRPSRDGPLLPRVAALAIAATTLPVPFLLGGPPLVRAFVALLLGLSFCRVFEIARAPWRFERPERAVRLATIFETRLMRRVPRSLPAKAWLLAAVFCAAGFAFLALAVRVGEPVDPYDARGWPRWILAAAGGYLLFEGLMRTAASLLPLFGWEHAPVQRAPIRSRSLAEFWGFRWNRIVGFWLQRNFFDPLARRGAPRWGILLAFAVSALLHMYLVAPVAGLVPALWMGAFFLAHGALAGVERMLGVKEWPPVWGHAFVLACFLATIPLFAEPLLRML
jgi:hypothetical protein